MTYKPSGVIPKIDVDELLKDIFANEHTCEVKREEEVPCSKPADWRWTMSNSCEHSPGEHYLCNACHLEMLMYMDLNGTGNLMQCQRCGNRSVIMSKVKIR